MMIKKLKNILLDIFFPPLCLGCEKNLTRGKEAESSKELSAEFLCLECQESIKLNSALFCPVCRARIPNNQKICHFDSAYLLAPASNYDNPVIQNLIHYFKYKKFETLAPFLGTLLVSYFQQLIENCELKIENFITIPIPLYPARERERGFNQAELLSKKISENFNLPLFANLKRVKHTEPQVGKKSEDRLKNISGCFRVKKPEEIQNKNIILVDDVFTSGATINEAVKILKTAGAKKIIALVVAKA